MTTARDQIRPLTFVFDDDGLVPNNILPLVIYKRAIELDGRDSALAIDELFRGNGWAQRWRDGIFDYQHYHATVHEALGVARGHALVLFGGEHGDAIQLNAGDVAILPAGTGHKCIFASHDFCVVGAYPPGETMEIARPTPENYRRASRKSCRRRATRCLAKTGRCCGCGGCKHRPNAPR